MRILITSGATREPIDSVRYISNMSTGRTGVFIADFLAQKGVEVHFLRGVGSSTPQFAATVDEFSSFQNLDQLLQSKLKATYYDAIVHTAAVSDFSVQNPTSGKISSETPELKLTLVRNFKIVERLKHYASESPDLKVIAFKLTDTPDPEVRLQAVRRLSLHPEIDFVVHNDLSEIGPSEAHSFTIYSANQKRVEGKTKTDLGLGILSLLKQPKTTRYPE